MDETEELQTLEEKESLRKEFKSQPLLKPNSRKIRLRKIISSSGSTKKAVRKTQNPIAQKVEFITLDDDVQLIEENSLISNEIFKASWVEKLQPLALCYTDDKKPYFQCSACETMSFSSKSFQKHLFSSHVIRNNDKYVCSYCNYSNTEPDILFTHLSQHKDQCESCNDNLMRKNNFKKHWSVCATNLTIKRNRRGRFVCTQCKLIFDTLPPLEKHWFKHTCRRKRIFQCKDCWGLHDTEQSAENHTCLKCPVCGEIYDGFLGLRAHTSWTKHFLKCPTCSYKFILTKDYDKHIALHQQVYEPIPDHLYCLEAADRKSFQCHLCDKIFFVLSRLVSHLKEDHSIKDGEQRSIEEQIKKEEEQSTTMEHQLGTFSTTQQEDQKDKKIVPIFIKSEPL